MNSAKYGRVEANLSLPNGMGGWPAFYLLPLDDAYGPWPSSGEIDILETYNLQPNLSTPVLSSLHYGYPIYTDKGLGQVRILNITSIAN
jgi:beta-glucanase (GH16 family)